jgi:hypothetical protein
MITRISDAQAKQVRAVSFPGGLARQYRVQYQQPGSAAWHVHGSYRQREEAEQAVETLQRNGLVARLIEYRYCPAAA